MNLRPPYATFTKPTCKGSIALGSACGHCEKCEWEKAQGVTFSRPGPRAQPSKATYDIGRDCYGRIVTAHFERTYDGKETWQIHRQEGDQRDTSEKVTGLTADNLRALADVVR